MKKIIVCFSSIIIIVSCGKKNDHPKVKTGYFPSQIDANYFADPSNNGIYHFRYNEYNEITQINTESNNYAFTYANHLLSVANVDGSINTFNYTSSGRLASIGDGSGSETVPVSYDESNKKYSWTTSSGSAYIDFTTNNAIEMVSFYGSLLPVTTGAKNDGVFKNLSFQPALSLLIAFSFANLEVYLLSPSSITSLGNSAPYTIENVRDDDNNIASATFIKPDGTPDFELNIAYEKRRLTP